MSREQLTEIARRMLVPVVGMLLLGSVTWPLLFTHSGFTGDWEHHMWLMWHQSLSLESDHAPTFFLNSGYSLFNPFYAFYGGTLYALVGALSLALGDAPVTAYVASYVLALSAALGGWYWLARIAGIGRWLAFVPGFIFISSAHYLMVIYVLGDWPECMAVSMIPLMVAACVSILRADRLRAGPAIALGASAVIFFGSHNITLLLGLTVFVLTGIGVVIFVPDARRHLTRRSVLRVGGTVLPAALLSAWYLLPALAYGSNTRLGREYAHSRGSIKETAWMVSLSHLFTFSRSTGQGLPVPYYMTMSLPILAIAWVIVGILILPRRSVNRAWLRLLLVCSGLAILIGIVMTHVGLLLALPHMYTEIQFSYRLENYIVLELCGAILAALAISPASGRPVRYWRWMAALVCLVSLVGAIQQLSGYPYPGRDRYATLSSYGQVDTGNTEDYQDNSERIISGSGLPTLVFPLADIHHGVLSARVLMRPGTVVSTDIAAGAYLVHVSGAKPIGIDAGSDDMVIRIQGPDARSQRGAPSGHKDPVPAERISVSTGDSLPIIMGRFLSIGALIALLAGLVLLAVRRRHL